MTGKSMLTLNDENYRLHRKIEALEKECKIHHARLCHVCEHQLVSCQGSDKCKFKFKWESDQCGTCGGKGLVWNKPGSSHHMRICGDCEAGGTHEVEQREYFRRLEDERDDPK